MNCDVAIIGGGPGGSTVGGFLKKYNPSLQVAIFEREQFPRDHVGESQLPAIGMILDELGVWSKVEEANFPLKIGATFRWGTSPDLWYFNFLGAEFVEEPRPAKFEGQRKSLAFQVDRAIYDEILLNHAASLGCEIHQSTKVAKVLRTGDRVDGLELENGEKVNARWYIDASGHVGILRRALGVPVTYPTNLQNVAFWDYWENAEWAETVGRSGTRVQVMSLGYGWIWFIPIGKTRTSVGLIMPAEHYKKTGKTPQELYAEALATEERISKLMVNATSEGKFQTTKDWSFLSERQAGENWFLVGESSGFADPILAAGLTITHTAAREAAFSILEIDRKPSEADWVKSSYERRLNKRIRNHIRFADFWYTANEQFSELKEFTREIAKENGLEMNSEQSWRWLAQGGFIDEDLFIGNGGIELAGIRDFTEFLYGDTPDSLLGKNNVFKLDLSGAKWHSRAVYSEGRVLKEDGYLRGDKLLPFGGVFEFWIQVLERASTLPNILQLWSEIREQYKGDPAFRAEVVPNMMSALEAMILDGWVIASYDERLPIAPVKFEHGTHRRVLDRK